jgi:hypothetical protein
MKKNIRIERGQTMVLFALTLLLITLMVMMTLSFSTKAKEKMELQQVADQAAFSNSVVTARAFNVVALLNRVEIAHMVAIAGIQAAASYAALYRGFLSGMVVGMQTRASEWYSRGSCGSCPLCWGAACEASAKLTRESMKLLDEDRRVNNEWTSVGTIGAFLGGIGFLDWQVGLEALAYQASAMMVFGVEMSAFVDMTNKLDDQDLTREIVAHASGGSSEWVVPRGGTEVNRREVGDVTTGIGAVMGAAQQATPFINQASVWAAMASRGNPWVTSRVGELGIIEDKLNTVLNPPPTGGVPDIPRWVPRSLYGFYRRMFPPVPATDPVTTVRIFTPGLAWGLGNSYFGMTEHAAGVPTLTDDKGVRADDHGFGNVSFWKAPTARYPVLSDAPILISATSTASAGAIPLVTNTHMWAGNFGMMGGSDMPPPPHRLLPTSGVGIWPLYIDYNASKALMPQDAYGQPKNFAVVQRDYRNRPTAADPWNLFFRFRLTDGPGQTFGQGTATDPRAIVLRDGTDISLQTALSTGIAYYHRYNHWREPPNLFNPFWRAGLSRANIDPKPMDGVGRDWFEDLESTLNQSNVPWAAGAMKELDRVGFQGVQ